MYAYPSKPIAEQPAAGAGLPWCRQTRPARTLDRREELALVRRARAGDRRERGPAALHGSLREMSRQASRQGTRTGVYAQISASVGTFLFVIILPMRDTFIRCL